MNWFQGLAVFCGIMAAGMAIRIALDVARHERWRRMAKADYEARRAAAAQADACGVEARGAALGTHAGAGRAPLGGDCVSGPGVNGGGEVLSAQCSVLSGPGRCAKCGVFHLGIGTDVCPWKGGTR